LEFDLRDWNIILNIIGTKIQQAMELIARHIQTLHGNMAHHPKKLRFCWVTKRPAWAKAVPTRIDLSWMDG
jgi:hypothetical protein